MEPWFNTKMTSCQYKKSHFGDKAILRPSYLQNGISYTGKMTSLYWIKPWYHKLSLEDGPCFPVHLFPLWLFVPGSNPSWQEILKTATLNSRWSMPRTGSHRPFILAGKWSKSVSQGLCTWLVWVSISVVLTHIIQGYFTGTGPYTSRLFHWYWGNHE